MSSEMATVAVRLRQNANTLNNLFSARYEIVGFFLHSVIALLSLQSLECAEIEAS